jgi:tRNA pseudouridine55 synthase
LCGLVGRVFGVVGVIKVGGERACALAREGEEVVLKFRAVTIGAFELLERRADELDVRVECSSGTYIRALARDLGADLGVGAHLTALRRTRIGPFAIEAAHELEGIDVAAGLIEPAAAASELFDRLQLDDEQALALTQGKRFTVDAPDGSPVAAVTGSGRLVGLVTIASGRVKALVNFPTDEALP